VSIRTGGASFRTLGGGQGNGDTREGCTACIGHGSFNGSGGRFLGDRDGIEKGEDSQGKNAE
jgi:hypothetical protein